MIAQSIIPLLAVLVRLAQASPAGLGDTYCTFYSDDQCKDRVGSVNYEIGNDNCFSNSGHFIKCDGATYTVRIESFDQGQCSGTAKALFGFTGIECTNIGGLADTGRQYKLSVGGQAGKVKRDNGVLEPVKRDEEVQGPANATLQKRVGPSTCEAKVDFYYGGECKGPASEHVDQVTAPGTHLGDVSPWLSECKTDGLFGMYELLESRCDFVVYEGDNCSGEEHHIPTQPVSCMTLNYGKYTVRSWKWSCDQTACGV